MKPVQLAFTTLVLSVAFVSTSAEYTVRDMQRDVIRDFAFRDRPIHPKVFAKFGGWLSDPPETNVAVAVDLTSVYKAGNEFFEAKVSVDVDVVEAVEDGITYSYRVVARRANEVTIVFRMNTGGTLTTSEIFRLAVVPGTVIKNGAVRDTLRLELRETIDAPESVARFLEGAAQAREDQISLTIAADEANRAADAVLNTVYNDLRESLKNDLEAWAMVRAAQRAWLTYRDLWVELESKPFEEGSIYSSYQLSILQMLTEEQTAHLKRLWVEGYPGDNER
jgi:uncharacterized protein YecT (DUF1311 family)